MTLVQIEKRVKALEQKVQTLTQSNRLKSRDWYRAEAGRFANDPAFEEILKLGRAYRRSQRPARQSKRR